MLYKINLIEKQVKKFKSKKQLTAKIKTYTQQKSTWKDKSQLTNWKKRKRFVITNEGFKSQLALHQEKHEGLVRTFASRNGFNGNSK
jgi:hypothetical protein